MVLHYHRLIDVDTKWSIIYDNIAYSVESSRLNLDRCFRNNFGLNINEQTFHFITLKIYPRRFINNEMLTQHIPAYH